MAYRNALPPQLEYIPYYDKIGHVLIYGIAAYLGERWVRHRRFRLLGVRLPLFVTLFSLFVVAEELVQYFSPHRNLDPGGSGHGCDRHRYRYGVGDAGAGVSHQGSVQRSPVAAPRVTSA
jgi:hypothetical protein